MKVEVLSRKESRNWKLAFWVLVLVPFVIALVCWCYTDLLQLLGFCGSKKNYWPPECIVGGMNLTAYVGIIITMMFYGYLIFELMAMAAYLIAYLSRRTFLKHRMKVNGGVP